MSLERISADRIYWTCECVEQVAGDFDEKHLDEKEYYIAEEADREIRKQKRKRCLALAKWCGDVRELMHRLLILDIDADRRRMSKCKWCRKWRNRWLAIADKYKEKNI